MASDSPKPDPTGSLGTFRLSIMPAVLERLEGLNLSQHLSNDHERVTGAGAYGDVWKGYLTTPKGITEVAVKRLRVHALPQVKFLFEKEIYVWSKLKHENVLPLLGYAFEKDYICPLIISPWLSQGSAWTYVHTHGHLETFHLVVGIARGLVYLHEKNVFHSDVKGSNILVSDSTPPKAIIADFGTARMVDASLSVGRPSITEKGTTRWMAYELHVFTDEGQPMTHCKATDVWAFGMTVYELFAKKVPYDTIFNELQVSSAIANKALPSFPAELEGVNQELTALLSKICEKCWQHDLVERITMSQVSDLLKLSPHYDEVEQENGTRVEDDSAICVSPHFPQLKMAGPVYCVMFSRSGDYIAVGCGRLIYIYCTNSGNQERIFEYTNLTGDLYVQSICFIDGQGSLVACTGNDSVSVWDTSPNKPTRTYHVNGQEILSLVCSGALIVCGLGNGTVQAISLITGKPKPFEQVEEYAAVTTVAISQNERFVAGGSSDGIRIWNVRDMKLVISITQHPAPVTSITFAMDNKIIIASSKSIIRRIISASAAEQPKLYDAHKTDVLSVAVSRDCQWIATGSKDGTVCFWNQETGYLERGCKEHNDEIVSVDFCPNSNKFVTADKGGEIKLWNYNVH